MKKINMRLLEENIGKIAEADFESKKGFAAAYSVYQEGNARLARCFGTLSPSSPEGVHENTAFRLASMTKPVTAVAAMLLESRGEISLSDPVEKYLPEFSGIRIKNAAGEDFGMPAKRPDLLSLLTHTSGIGSDADKNSNISAQDKATRQSYLAYLLRSGLDFEPGERQLYSGLGAFDVMARIIELVSGESLEDFFQREILAPCGMKNTTFLPGRELLHGMVQMHDRIAGENAVRPMMDGCVFEDYPETHFLGGAGLVSTLSDYSAFAMMLLDGGRTRSGQLASKFAFEKMRTPQVSEAVMPGFERWGLGVRVITDARYPYLPAGAFGWSGAYGTHFWVDHVNRICAVFMKNSCVDGGAGNESAGNFERAVYSSFE